MCDLVAARSNVSEFYLIVVSPRRCTPVFNITFVSIYRMRWFIIRIF